MKIEHSLPQYRNALELPTSYFAAIETHRALYLKVNDIFVGFIKHKYGTVTMSRAVRSTVKLIDWLEHEVEEELVSYCLDKDFDSASIQSNFTLVGFTMVKPKSEE